MTPEQLVAGDWVRRFCWHLRWLHVPVVDTEARERLESLGRIHASDESSILRAFHALESSPDWCVRLAPALAAIDRIPTDPVGAVHAFQRWIYTLEGCFGDLPRMCTQHFIPLLAEVDSYFTKDDTAPGVSLLRANPELRESLLALLLIPRSLP